MNFKKYLLPVLLLLLLFGSLGLFQFRWDLTADKRYTLSDATVETLQSVTEPVTVNVYLEGDFPASFRQLRNETEFMLREFRKINPKIDFAFIDPIKEKLTRNELEGLGMTPSVLPDVRNGKMSQIVIFPYADVRYKDRHIPVPLIIARQGIDATEQLSRSIESLEYNLVSSVKNITDEEVKNVGFLVNHDELDPDHFHSFIEMALENYNIGPVVPENGNELSAADLPKLSHMDALVIAKPRKPFTDGEKLVLDQYIMRGGKTLWMLDAVNAEMDTLFVSKKIMAYPVDNGLTDLLFNYGVRINSALVKDFKQAALLRVAAGEVAGNPQYNSFIWPYFPLGISDKEHPITKNVNPVKFEFPTAIDTLKRPGIKTTVLYESSDRTQIKSTPNFVELSEIAAADSLGQMESRSAPKIFSVLLEGKFKSAYTDRTERNEINNFVRESPENKMIVISDGDVAKNNVVKGEPTPLGFDLLTGYLYGNEQFLRNALDYLLDDAQLMTLRDRSAPLRLLDRQLAEERRGYFRWLNLLAPLLVCIAGATLFFYLRKRKFG